MNAGRATWSRWPLGVWALVWALLSPVVHAQALVDEQDEGARAPAPSLAPVEPLGEIPPQEPHGQLDGEWYSAAVSCTFCDTVFGQEISINPKVLYKFADKALVDVDLKGGKMLLRAEKTLVPLIILRRETGSLLFILYNEGDLPRVGETFARVWDLSLTANDKLLYGRAYTIYSFNDAAFDEAAAPGRYRARTEWLPPEKILALMGDVRITSLQSDRRLFVPVTDVRVSYEGATALVRLDLSPADMMVAQQEAQRVLAQRGETDSLYRTLVSTGDLLFAQGQYDKAIEQYQAASRIVPENALAYADIGASLQLKGKYAEAERSYQMAIDLSVPDPDLYFNMAVSLEGQKLYPRAVEYYKKVLELRPTDAGAQERLVVLGSRLP